MSAGLKVHSKRKSTGSPSDRRLFVAFELSQSTWKVALATGPGGSVRQREVPAGNIGLVLAEIAAAKRKWRLPSRPGPQLLRSGPRWILAAPLPGGARDREPDPRFVQHRSEPPGPAG